MIESKAEEIDKIMGKCYASTLMAMIDKGWNLNDMSAAIGTIGGQFILKAAQIRRKIDPNCNLDGFLRALDILKQDIKNGHQ